MAGSRAHGRGWGTGLPGLSLGSPNRCAVRRPSLPPRLVVGFANAFGASYAPGRPVPHPRPLGPLGAGSDGVIGLGDIANVLRTSTSRRCARSLSGALRARRARSGPGGGGDSAAAPPRPALPATRTPSARSARRRGAHRHWLRFTDPCPLCPLTTGDGVASLRSAPPRRPCSLRIALGPTRFASPLAPVASHRFWAGSLRIALGPARFHAHGI